jgi:hypothetical protein
MTTLATSRDEDSRAKLPRKLVAGKSQIHTKMPAKKLTVADLPLPPTWEEAKTLLVQYGFKAFDAKWLEKAWSAYGLNVESGGVTSHAARDDKWTWLSSQIPALQNEDLRPTPSLNVPSLNVLLQGGGAVTAAASDGATAGPSAAPLTDADFEAQGV